MTMGVWYQMNPMLIYEVSQILYQCSFNVKNWYFTLNLLPLYGNSRYIDVTTPVTDANTVGNEIILHFNYMYMYAVRKWDI